MVAALVLTGAPGTGKSSVLEALTTLLEIDGTSYGAIESEQLAWGSPWLPAADWLPQLRAVIEHQRQAGRQLFLITATTETAEELGGVLAAVDAELAVVACLDASPELVATRIAEREPNTWPGKQALITHARQLARSIPTLERIDVIIDTERREPVDVAHEVRKALKAHGALNSR